MKASEVLRKAGDVLRRYGWCQESRGESATSTHCVIGAIEVAKTGGLDVSVEPGFSAYSMDELEWLDVIVDVDLTIDVWNDIKGRTPEEVQLVLDAAYVLALQAEGADLDEVFA